MFNITYKMTILIFSFLAVCAGGWLWIHHQPQKKHAHQLIVGTCSGFPPYEILDDAGNLVGFDIDVAHALGQCLHKEVIFKDMAYDALVLSLKQGSIDVAIAGISITKTKLKEVALVHYQGAAMEYIPLLFWQHIPDDIATIHDMQKIPHATVCVQAGNLEEEILSTYPFITLKQLGAIADLIMDIKYGKSIAASVDPEVAQVLLQQVPELKMLTIPLAQDQQPLGQGICLAPHNTFLIQQVQSAVAQLKQDGTLKALEAQWFKGAAHGNTAIS